ncbi:hypothetical protein MUK42_18334 [Musa troglodytarum]|uniref:Uncharacterized protein n=1 Tax=Musa troglodytarum TaxID=320322 RepID=A0A9E7JWN5_9LILI|nr:hypothetical protein MUK42_18334 [Musa troglodytarum]
MAVRCCAGRTALGPTSPFGGCSFGSTRERVAPERAIPVERYLKQWATGVSAQSKLESHGLPHRMPPDSRKEMGPKLCPANTGKAAPEEWIRETCWLR